MNKQIPVLAMALITLLVLMTGVTAAQQVGLELQPNQQSINSGEEANIDVVVTDAENGVGSYEFTVELSDPGVAAITGHSTPNQPALSDTSINEDNSSIEFADVMGSQVYQGGDEIVIATIMLEAHSGGETQISINDGATVFDAVGADYQVTETQTASLQVSGAFFSVEITDIPSDAAPGDEITVTSAITNTGNQAGTQNTELVINGETKASTEVTLEPGEDTEVELTGTLQSDAEDEVSVTVRSTSSEDTGTISIQEESGGLPLPGLGFIAALIAITFTAGMARKR